MRVLLPAPLRPTRPIAAPADGQVHPAQHPGAGGVVAGTRRRTVDPSGEGRCGGLTPGQVVGGVEQVEELAEEPHALRGRSGLEHDPGVRPALPRRRR